MSKVIVYSLALNVIFTLSNVQVLLKVCLEHHPGVPTLSKTLPPLQPEGQKLEVVFVWNSGYNVYFLCCKSRVQ
jgi:hypothetical protein